ncbi:hypothetical protein PV410_37170 [Streptomyces sp. PA03-5A]|nr:hypothetical protein [Streptomyces sp. PA03-5A]
MSFPPPSPPDDPRPGQGGGFGPPPGGFGPPQYQPQPQQQYQPQPQPYQNQPQFPGPAQQGGGYGYPPPPQPPRSGGGAKVAAIVIGAVVLIAVVVGGLAIALSGGEDDDKGATGSTSSSPTASAPATQDTATASTEPDPSEIFRKYVVLSPGQCFDDPGLDSGVTEVTTVSCNGPHDAEVIANETITGTFDTEAALKAKVLKLCEADAAKRLKDVKDNPGYYYYALYPKLSGYQVQGKDTISCSLTLSNKLDGKKLTKPLP